MSSVVQLELFPPPRPAGAGEIAEYLGEGCDQPVHVTLTKNRVSMVSVDFGGSGVVKVRLHEDFRRAPPSVFRSLKSFLRTRRKAAWRDVSAFAKEIAVVRPGATGRSRLRARGRVHDLAAMSADVNRTFFSGRVKCRIGWGRRVRRTRRARTRTIHFGSWNPGTRTVRVHPALDDTRVPAEFVRYIVFHEMLHAVVPEVRSNGRRYDHSAQFRALENTFPGIDRMRRLSRKLVDEL